jgi:2-(1,2-epoxy-1,2-dihydrophenyl)acetyl-CoA isomerase
VPTIPASVARNLYDAFARGEGEALFDLLTDDFVGSVSTGMPHGVGGDHRGRLEMITGVWGRIASIYDMHVDPLEFLPVDDTRVVVLGRYWGPARDGSCSVDAAFAHIITTHGDQVAALQQITDTARWSLPAAS